MSLLSRIAGFFKPQAAPAQQRTASYKPKKAEGWPYTTNHVRCHRKRVLAQQKNKRE